MFKFIILICVIIFVYKKFISIKSKENHLKLEDTQQVFAVCPACSGNIYDYDDGYRCNNCFLFIPKQCEGISLSTANAKDLLQLKHLGPYVIQDENNNFVEIEFFLDLTKGIQFDNIGICQTIGKCPICGSVIVKGTQGYVCIHNSKVSNGNCSFFINKQFNDYELTEDDVKTILEKGYTEEHIIQLENGHYMKIYYKFDRDSNLVQEKIKIVIGKCPKCGGDFCEAEKCFYCENNKKDKTAGCDAWIPKIVGGHKITDKDLGDLLAGNSTEKHRVLNKNKIECEVRFFLGGKRGFDAEFIHENKNQTPNRGRTVVGKCPLCGGNVYVASKKYYCGSCNFSFPKKVKGSIIDEDNMALMLKGEQTEPIMFRWKNGHDGYACLYLEKDELKWLFMESDYS